MQDLEAFQVIEEYTGMLMTGEEINCHNTHASNSGIGGMFCGSSLLIKITGLMGD